MESSCIFDMVSSSSRLAQVSLQSDTAVQEGGRKPHGLLRPRHKSHFCLSHFVKASHKVSTETKDGKIYSTA